MMVIYDGIDYLFAVKRKDRKIGAKFNIANRTWQYLNISPRLVGGVEKYSSNIDLYAYKRGYVKVGISKEF